MNIADLEMIEGTLHDIKKKALESHQLEITDSMDKIIRILNRLTLHQRNLMVNYYNQIDKS